MPPLAFAVVEATGNIYSGLCYPLIGVALTFGIGLLVLPETRGPDSSIPVMARRAVRAMCGTAG